MVEHRAGLHSPISPKEPRAKSHLGGMSIYQLARSKPPDLLLGVHMFKPFERVGGSQPSQLHDGWPVALFVFVGVREGDGG